MKNMIGKLIATLAFGLAIFHIYAGGIQLLPATQQRAIHLGIGLTLIFLIYPLSKKENANALLSKMISYPLAALSLVITIYISINYIDVITNLSRPNSITLFISAATILLVLEAARRVLGLALTIISGVFLAYAFWGHQLPLMVAHSGISVDRILTQVGLSSSGIFGTSLGVSATYVILFIIFGSFLERSGAGSVFINFSMSAVGRYRGGSAKVSVVASSLFGSISGSQVANVVSTGVLTIPLMKKGGYSPTYAAAVESVASTGGMILPPVMGAVAFLMADYLQVPFAEVALAALIPALLYYFAVFMMVDARAAKENIRSDVDNTIDLKKLIVEKGHLAIPLVILVLLLMVFELSTVKAVFWSILSVPIISYFRKETRMGIKDIAGALVDGVKMSLVVIAACACAGIVIGVIDMTGIGLRFSGLLLELAGGNLLILAILTMIASIVLGMGLPPVACYLILAVLAAPALINLGVEPMAAHLFIFYFGTLSAITPPVAIASYAAAGIAKTNPFKVSLQACRIGIVAFIIPFMFIYGPELLLQGEVFNIAYAILTAVVGVYILAGAVEGYLYGPIPIVVRTIIFITAIALIQTNMLISTIALVITVILLAYLKKRGPVVQNVLTNTTNEI
ncbi:TRAP transporter 4TM/12TM fusion protein [Ureibacillus xyleni]|uniref:TRAP transporter 4TM/12TM fusion protein n=1 Tax=Ureibacillus xyleni TaxID=614648 RepID=A0A285RWE5_9BACL|nr:TRAP transporter permease [Ureibacillus xyleni]SOB98838.1 TRAP transporter 4TM/12TM fusion protein [Ureibacillus xyleni]